MVCQANQEWELLLDVTRCPDLAGASSYNGRGCVGAALTCDEPGSGKPCECNAGTQLYQCAVGLE